jgi:LuxR family transcriptional regulator, maltose regulon positive regulatory protein
MLDRLERAMTQPFTWVAAPAGYGKTALLAQWRHRRCRVPSAWISAAAMPNHDDAVATLVAAIAALADRPVVDPVDVDRALATLLPSCPPSVLVIDGCEDDALTTTVLDLAGRLERAPSSGLRVVVTSRAQRMHALVPLRLRGAAAVLNSRDFVLDATDTAAVINELIPGTLDEPTAQEVAAQLDGWIAGARLLGLAYRSPAKPTADHLFAAARSDLDGYVASEILGRVGDDEQRFLLLTAAVEDPPAALCDVMSGRNDAELLIAHARNHGLPLRRDVEELATLAHLAPVRAALDRIAVRHLPEDRGRAIRAAAGWYSAQGRPFDAAWLFVGVEAWDDAINVIYLHLRPILDSDEISRLADLAGAMPPDLMRERVGLAVGAAYTLRMDGRIAAALELLNVFEPFMSPAGVATANTVRAGAVSHVPDVRMPLAAADAVIQAGEQIEEDWEDAIRRTVPIYSPVIPDTFPAIARSYALLACAYAGLWPLGERYLVDIRPETATSLPQLQVIQRHGSRATFLALGGRASSALGEATAGLAIADSGDMPRHRVAADAYFAVGESLRLMLRYDEAAEALATSLELAEMNTRWNLMAAIVASQAHLAVDRGDDEAARAALESFKRDGYQPPATLAGLLAAAEARARGAGGDMAGALQILEEAEWTEATASTLITVLATLGQIGNARAAHQRWPHRDTLDAKVRWHLAAALIHTTAGQRSEADSRFVAALSAAGREQLLQPFVEAAPASLRLLQHVTPAIAPAGAIALATRLRAAPVLAASATALPSLTEQEHKVLGLLAGDLATREIADALHVSVNTVRAHLRSIYRKLGVPSRREAVRAYQAGRADRDTD